MKKPIRVRKVIAAFAFVLAAVAAILHTPAQAQEVIAYCAKMGNLDRLQPLPAALVPSARQLFDLAASMPEPDVRATTFYRCLNGAVLLCNAGANLVCDKADVARRSPGAEGFCRNNPDSDSVPMSATGHATVYEWKCVGRMARAGRMIMKVDPRGFIAANWKQLK